MAGAKMDISTSSSVMLSWTFPFKTCEAPIDSQIACQPYSFAINLVSTLSLLGFAYNARRPAVALALCSYALFEAFHTYSHAVHTVGSFQHLVIHTLGYVISLCTWAALHSLTGGGPMMPGMRNVVLMAYAVDVCTFLVGGGLWMVMTGLTVLVLVFLSYWPHMPVWFKHRFRLLVGGLALLFLLFVNEAHNCQRMLEFSLLPWHAAIEVLGLALFLGVGSSLMEWDAHAHAHNGLTKTKSKTKTKSRLT